MYGKEKGPPSLGHPEMIAVSISISASSEHPPTAKSTLFIHLYTCFSTNEA